MNKSAIIAITSVIIGIAAGVGIMIATGFLSKTNSNAAAYKTNSNIDNQQQQNTVEARNMDNRNSQPTYRIDNNTANNNYVDTRANSAEVQNNREVIVHILDVTPQISTSVRHIPYNSCQYNNNTQMVTRAKQDGTNGTIIGGATGAVAGAVIGKNLAGNDAGTAVGGIIGAVAGGAIGNSIERNQTEQVPVTTNSRECVTRYRAVTSKHVYGYKVIYEYQGQQRLTTVKRRPYGNYVPLNTLL